MIVVIGGPAWRAGEHPGPDGSAVRIALIAAAEGARVELVGRIGDDAAGDATLAALSRAGIGHAAILRDPAHPTPVVQPLDPVVDDDPTREEITRSNLSGLALDAADIQLGLRYLTDFRVLVIAEQLDSIGLRTSADGALYAGAHLVVVADQAIDVDLPPETVIFGAPADTTDTAFATIVGVYAARVDSGRDLKHAFEEAAAAVTIQITF